MKQMTLFFSLLSMTLIGSAQESLKISWLDKYEWQVLSNQENDQIDMKELVPRNQKSHNWSMLGQMVTMKNAPFISLEEAMELMYDQTLKHSVAAQLTFIEKNEEDAFPWILFKIESPDFKDKKKPESQLWYIRKGKTSLFINFIALKKKQLKEPFIAEWSEVFKASEVLM